MLVKPKMIKSKYRSLLLPGLVVVAIILLLCWRYLTPEKRTDAVPTAKSAQTRQASGQGKGGRRSAAIPPVQAATASQQDVPRFLTGLGTATAANTVKITSRVEGQLMALHFQEGQQVKTGDLLAEIDPRPYQVQLTQAEGQLAKDQAILANAKQDLARYQQLSGNKLISQQDLENQRSLVRQSEGAVKAGQGAVDHAKLQLTYSKITTPINGRVGLKLIDIGNFITSGNSDAIVVITQTDPIEVIFTLPENTIADLLHAQKTGAVSVEAWDRTNQHFLAKGTLLSMDNQIDVTTGTIKLKARFDNQDALLFPNQFVNARLQVDMLQNAVVIPSAALQMSNEGHFVWLLQPGNKVSKQRVIAGLQDSQQAVISTGVTAGDRVITDGIDRLVEGMQVDVLAPIAPKASTVQGKS